MSLWNSVAGLFRDPKPRLTRRESLNGVPVRSQGIESHEGPEGQRLLVVPRKAPASPFMKWCAPREPVRIELDRYGNAVWQSIDGKRNVKSIVALFAEQFKLHPREAEAGVVEFLNMLMRRGLVAIMFKNKV